MDARPLIDRVLEDEGLTAGLDEPEATLLVTKLITVVRDFTARSDDANATRHAVEGFCRRARLIAEVVTSYRDQGEVTARQLAARHRIVMPPNAQTTNSLMQQLLGSLSN